MSAKIQNNNSKIEIDTSCARQSDKKMKFLSWYYKYTESAILNYFKMPSTPYDLVQDDQDLRIPLHAEQAFFHGITFQAKVSSYSSMDSVHFISFFPFGVYFLSWILCCFQICIRIRLISLCNRKKKLFRCIEKCVSLSAKIPIRLPSLRATEKESEIRWQNRFLCLVSLSFSVQKLSNHLDRNDNNIFYIRDI